MNDASKWIHRLIVLGAGFFILALFASAVFDPRIRVLHALQALIYVAVIVLTKRRSAWGFGAGFSIAILWNYTNLFVTSFVTDGLKFLWLFCRTGQLKHPDLLVAVIAAGGHFLLIAACAAGFWLLSPRIKESTQFIAGGVLAVAYFIVIIMAFGPQYVPLLRRVFHF